jgi:hypothetical protein
VRVRAAMISSRQKHEPAERLSGSQRVRARGLKCVQRCTGSSCECCSSASALLAELGDYGRELAFDAVAPELVGSEKTAVVWCPGARLGESCVVGTDAWVGRRGRGRVGVGSDDVRSHNTGVVE